MFASLNRFISRLDGDPVAQTESRIQGAWGFQVLRNSNDDVPLEPWFDFIVGINGRQIDNPDPNLFIQEVRNLAGNSISLDLWSTKGQRAKRVWIAVPTDGSPLGISLQWVPLTSTEEVWHVLDVAPNSPADLAGLLPYGDYIIGSPEGIARGENGLGELIEHFLEKPLRLHVYNHEYNVTRLLTLTPSRNWGGSGALGCVLGYGALHRIPAPLDEPPSGPGETLFETASANGDARASMDGTQAEGQPQYLVPAEMDLARSGSPSAPPRGGAKKGRAKHGAAAVGKGDMDAYFAEEEEKSRQLESSSSSSKPSKDGPLPPPPPKASAGPPKASTPSQEQETQKAEEEKS